MMDELFLITVTLGFFILCMLTGLAVAHICRRIQSAVGLWRFHRRMRVLSRSPKWLKRPGGFLS